MNIQSTRDAAIVTTLFATAAALVVSAIALLAKAFRVTVELVRDRVTR